MASIFRRLSEELLRHLLVSEALHVLQTSRDPALLQCVAKASGAGTIQRDPEIIEIHL